MSFTEVQNINDITGEIVDASIKVHRSLGPGLLERVYEECLCFELDKRGMRIERQKQVSVLYEELLIESAFRLDVLVEDTVIVELKSAELMLPVYEAQILTYMKLARKPLGLLINFNVPLVKDGIKRFKL